MLSDQYNEPIDQVDEENDNQSKKDEDNYDDDQIEEENTDRADLDAAGATDAVLGNNTADMEY